VRWDSTTIMTKYAETYSRKGAIPRR
jgi:hypothetical protein